MIAFAAVRTACRCINTVGLQSFFFYLVLISALTPAQPKCMIWEVHEPFGLGSSTAKNLRTLIERTSGMVRASEWRPQVIGVLPPHHIVGLDLDQAVRWDGTGPELLIPSRVPSQQNSQGPVPETGRDGTGRDVGTGSRVQVPSNFPNLANFFRTANERNNILW